MLKNSFYLVIFIVLLTLLSCVRQPDAPQVEHYSFGENGAYILCEGLMGQDNSSLSRFDLTSNTIVNNYYSKANIGLYLGDTANDIVIKGDTAFVVVSTNQKIVVFRVSTGKLLHTIRFKGNRFPRKMCIVNDSIAFVTDLYDHSISKFNPTTFKIIKEHIPVGPAPEGIAFYNNYLFVANSGYGDYLADKPKAGTISVIDINSLNEIKLLTDLPNIIEIKIDSNHSELFARYNNLPKYKDSTGGIVEYDLNNLTEKRRWHLLANSMQFSENHDTLFFLSSAGVEYINLNSDTTEPRLLIKNIDKSEIWYSLAINPDDNSFWIGNAMDYQSQGKILIYEQNKFDKPISIFNCGVNPNTIVFY